MDSRWAAIANVESTSMARVNASRARTKSDRRKSCSPSRYARSAGTDAVVTDETVDAGVPELPWDGEVVADFVLAWMEAR